MHTWTPLGPVNSFPQGQPTCITAADTPVVICPIATNSPGGGGGGGGVCVVKNQCPHAGLPIGDGDLRGRVLTCPYHNYPYDVATGRHLLYPHEEPPLRIYRTRIIDGILEIEMETHPQHPDSPEEAEHPQRDPDADDSATPADDTTSEVEDPDTPTGYPDHKRQNEPGTVLEKPAEPEGEPKS